MSKVIDILSKQYGTIQALKNLSFQVDKGKCRAGPNGAGKSTTLKILMGLLKPSKGNVKIMGINPTWNPKAVYEFISYVPDYPNLYDEITVEQNIELFQRIYKAPKEKIQEIIHKVSLTEKTKEKAGTLSKGLKQRLLIARALVHNPKIIFLDEPTTGLDPSSTDLICKILEELKNNRVTMILSTHLMYLAERLCDHIVLLNKGEKQEEGSGKELQKKYKAKRLEDIFIHLIRKDT